MRLVQDVLVRELGISAGFLDERVVVLDPALGTGNYLLAVAAEAEKSGGAASLAGRVTGLELRPEALEIARRRLSGVMGREGMDLRQANTLELRDARPDLSPDQLPVILGNPPYGRHGRADGDHPQAGGWVRWGDDGDGQRSLMQAFTGPARAAGHGQHLKNLYNQYVYFMRWALWQALERQGRGHGPAVVSFVTAASFLDGAAFCGLRQHMRRQCDEVRILDLGGEGRGTRPEQNVFDIQTPVVIFIAWRRGDPDLERPAVVRYVRLGGTRQEKLRELGAIQLDGQIWRDVPSSWQRPLRPEPSGAVASWPTLEQLMPWRANGVKAGRTWVIAPERGILRRRLAALLAADGQAARVLFKDSPTGRKYGDAPFQLPPSLERLEPLAELRSPGELATAPLGYRFLDRQLILADARLLDRASPSLWRSHGPRQLYLSTLSTNPLGPGPALTATALIPDLHHFRGSFGARDQVPLYLDREGTQPNLRPGLQERVAQAMGDAPTPEEMAGYLYGVLAHPAYQARHAEALLARQVRVPLTSDGVLFTRASFLGRMLLWLHTYGERLSDEFGALPHGSARCLEVPGGCPDAVAYDETAREIVVGVGETAGRFGPVAPEVWAFSVSGYQVARSWLGQRMMRRRGRRSSPLDDIRPAGWSRETTDELLRLLAVLEETLHLYPDLAELLGEIEAGPLISGWTGCR